MRVTCTLITDKKFGSDPCEVNCFEFCGFRWVIKFWAPRSGQTQRQKLISCYLATSFRLVCVIQIWLQLKLFGHGYFYIFCGSDYDRLDNQISSRQINLVLAVCFCSSRFKRATVHTWLQIRHKIYLRGACCSHEKRPHASSECRLHIEHLSKGRERKKKKGYHFHDWVHKAIRADKVSLNGSAERDDKWQNSGAD